MTARRAPNLLTVVQREFLRDGRRWQTWALRTGFVTALYVLLALLWAERTGGAETLDRVAIGRTGRVLFQAFVAAQTVALVLITPVLVATAVIEERDGGTLPLLALTRLSPAGILGGKVLARVLQIELVVLGGLPFLALCSSLGGFGPVDLLNVFVQSTTMILGLAAVSAFLGLYSDGAFRPAIQTWFWTIGAWWMGSLPHLLMQFDGGAAATVSPTLALYNARGWQILGPPVAQVPVALGILWFAVAGLRAMLAGADDENDGFGSLGGEFGGLRTVRKSLAWSVAIIILGVPFVLFQKPLGALFPPLGQLSLLWTSVWIWLGSGIYLLTVRYALLRQAKKRGRAPKKRWSQLTKEWDGAATHGTWKPAPRQAGHRGAPAVAPARAEAGSEADAWASGVPAANAHVPDEPRGIRSVGAQVASLSGRAPRRAERVTRSRRWFFGREVWDDSVLWRETMTRAWGGLGGSLTRLSTAGACLVGLLFFLGLFREPEFCLFIAAMAITYSAAATLLSSSASIAGELRHGTLGLLLASRLSPARILRSKLSATLLFAGPPWLLASCLVWLAAMFASDGSAQPQLKTMMLRWIVGSAWTATALTALAVSCHSIGLRAQTAARVWVWTVLWAGLNVVGPVLLMIFVEGIDLGEQIVGWWNPLFAEDTWSERGLPHSMLVSTGVWGLIAAGAFVQNTQLIRRRAAR